LARGRRRVDYVRGKAEFAEAGGPPFNSPGSRPACLRNIGSAALGDSRLHRCRNRESTAFRALVDIAKLRWRMVPKARFQHDERDYQDLEQEIGLGLQRAITCRVIVAPRPTALWCTA